MSSAIDTLTPEVDTELRRYATWLNHDIGEDSYHNAVCEMLARKPRLEIRDPLAFYRRAIKYAVYKIYRDEATERRLLEALFHNAPIPQHVGLAVRHQKQPQQTHCRQGHLLSEDNLAYIGPRRTCRTCKRARELLAAQRKRQQAREATDVA